MQKRLSLGKLDFRLLENLLKKYQGVSDPRVVIGPRVGEDAAVIDLPDRYLVAKTDPITFATEKIGWYAVQVNGNDIAIRGASPKWFQATILLPEKRTTRKLVGKIFAQISFACKKLGVAMIGGHTEISWGLDRPIVIGCMLGEVEKEKLVCTSGAKPRDMIVLTKGIVIEGTSIIAFEKQEELKKKGYSSAFIQKCQSFLYNPGISVVKEALLANQFEVHSMHDPTEGGLAVGLYEIAVASKVGLLIEKEKIPVLEESVILCKEYNLDPLRTITSGTLLITTPLKSSQKIIRLLKRNGIKAGVIGEVKQKDFGIKILSQGKIRDLKISAQDEITKIFNGYPKRFGVVK